MLKPCVFLDRDGVLNKDKVDYVYEEKDLIILPQVASALLQLKRAGYFLIVITNQSGIDKGIYKREDTDHIHNLIQKQTGHCIDDFYVSPYYKGFTASLGRKPGTLMFEKAMAKYPIDAQKSWMVGDRLRDLEPALKLGLEPILIEDNLYGEPWEGKKAPSLFDAVNKYILKG